jgi:hypothetical protein
VIGIAAQSAGSVQLLTVGFAIPALYACGVTGAALLARDLPFSVRARVPVVLATMHMTWGLGFLTSPRKFARAERPQLAERARAGGPSAGRPAGPAGPNRP